MDYSVMKSETLNQVLITDPNMTTVMLMLSFTDMKILLGKVDGLGHTNYSDHL